MEVLPINSINFSAKIKRSKLNTQECTIKNPSKKDIARFYDKEVQDIVRQKEFVLELDSFIHSDKVKEKVETKLPKKHLFEVDSNLIFYGHDDLSIIPPFLFYTPRNSKGEQIQDTIGFSHTQNDDGSVNKEGILNWIDELIEIFGKK